jgi:hypothetical protein
VANPHPICLPAQAVLVGVRYLALPLTFVVLGLAAAISLWVVSGISWVLLLNVYIFLWYIPSAAMYWTIWRRRGKCL